MADRRYLTAVSLTIFVQYQAKFRAARYVVLRSITMQVIILKCHNGNLNYVKSVVLELCFISYNKLNEQKVLANMTRCAVLNCPNYTGKKSMDNSTRFHVFPKDPKIFREWAKVCRGNVTNSTKYRICSAHFEESEFRLKDILLNVPKNKRCLKKGAIPTINVISPNSALLKRKIRNRRKLVEEALRSYEQAKTILPVKIDFSQQTEVQENENKEVQTEEIITGSDRELRAIKAKARVRRLKAKLEKERNRVTSSVYTESKLRTVFTAGQIRRLEQPDKKLRWSEEDLASALTLYNAGGRAYRILIKRGIPLPAPSTVRKSRDKFEVKATTETTTTTPTLTDHTYC